MLRGCRAKPTIYLQHVDHVFRDILIDVIHREEVWEGSRLKGKQVLTFTEPWVGHQLSHLDTVLWIGRQQSPQEIFAAYSGMN